MPRHRSIQVAAVSAALVVATLAAFSGARSNSFLNYDDDVYVTENPHVVNGVSGENVRWALRSTEAANWHPATWLSHMIDVELFGFDAGRHHMTSVVLHAVNAVLLFLLFVRMTGALWRSAFVAGLFALHPLHVESVAWIAERKDVLSTLFWLLTTMAWLRWLSSKTAARYALVVACFAVGLMAKPMLVTLPLTLMLLDVWPLARAPYLWKEKVPLFAMAAGSCVVTLVAQHRGGTILALSGLSLPSRVGNAAVTYGWYLGKTVWPTELAAFYPHPGAIRAWPAIVSALLLVGVTALAIRLARRAPYLAVGWSWYLVTLVPVIGLVQVGLQSAADRYTYVPLVGVFVAVSWGLAAIAEARPPLRPAVAAVSTAVLVALIPVTRAQVRHWKNNTTLFEHALAVTSSNCLAHNNLGLALAGAGQLEAAVTHYDEALRIKPDYIDAMSNRGAALHRLGRYQEAIDQLERALAVHPESPGVEVNLGNSLVATGRIDAAIEHYQRALRMRPGFYDAHQNLGLVLDNVGRHDEAITHYEQALHHRPSDAAAHLGLAAALSGAGRLDAAIPEFDAALRLKPDYAQAYNAWGIALAAVGRNAEALDRYDRALRLRPDDAAAMNNAGLALAAMNRVPEAIDRFERAVRINPQFARAHNNLAVALAGVNRVPEAIEHFERAVSLDPGLVQAQANLRGLQEAAQKKGAAREGRPLVR